MTAADYRKTLDIYTRSQRLKLDNGQVVPWIDENLNPLTGVWWARELKLRKKTYYGRGDHYNHSSYADLVITGLMGLRPRADDVVEVNPLAPPEWDWFALDGCRITGANWPSSGIARADTSARAPDCAYIPTAS